MTVDLEREFRACTEAVTTLFHQEQEFGDWPEERDATREMLKAAHGKLLRLKFHQGEESRNGADWLWWFVSAERSFGILIQAKVLRRRKRSTGPWTIGFDHKVGVQHQDELLYETADELGVPFAYMLYFGPPEYRTDVPKGLDRPEAMRDQNMSVALLDGLMYWTQVRAFMDGRAPHRQRVDDAYRAARPLVSIAERAGDYEWRGVHFAYPDHLHIWQEIQEDARTLGAAAVAGAMIRYLTAGRERQFVVTDSAPATVQREVVYTELPQDRGHFPQPLLPYLLRGYRFLPPQYVEDALSGRTVVNLPESVAGLVVFDERV